MSGLISGRLTAKKSFEPDKGADDKPIKVPLPRIRQSHNWTCGDAALESVDAGFGGKPIDEMEIADKAHATPETGTTPGNLLDTARELGLYAELREHMTVQDLVDNLDQGNAIITDIQAWADPGESYERRESGHYVVCTGRDDKNLYFVDPTLGTGAYGYIPRDEMVDRWIDKEEDGPETNQLGIIIRPAHPLEPEPLDHAEKIAVHQLKPINARRPFLRDWQHLAEVLQFLEHAKVSRKYWTAKRAEEELIDESDPDEDRSPALKTAAPILGIRNRADYGDLSRLQPGQILDIFRQQHAAIRSGEHEDLRVGDPDLGLYSWATRKPWPAPGERPTGVYRQPLHEHSYGPFEGILRGGYGAGTVKQKTPAGKVLITRVSPRAIGFTIADKEHGQRFLLVKPDKAKREHDWLLMNVTPTGDTGYIKQHMTKLPAEQVEESLKQMQPGQGVQAKIDGAASLTKLLHNGVEVMSYRTSRETGRPIIYSERMGLGPGTASIPKHLVGTVLRGELYGVRRPAAGRSPALDGQTQEQVIPPQELGGLLNSVLHKSLHQQAERGIDLRTALFDIQQLGGQPIDWKTVPYAERRRMLEEIVPYLPDDKFHLSEQADTLEDALALWNKIREGRHSLTNEGVVFYGPQGATQKSKLLDESDVHITGTFPAGLGKYRGNAVGGFEYALTPGGEPVGRTGTGFSDELRRDMFSNPDKYIGRVAKIRSQGQFPGSGAYRGPSFLSLHEDVDPAAKVAAVGPIAHLTGLLGSGKSSPRVVSCSTQ